MKVQDAFPSKYLRAADVESMGGELNYTIKRIVIEEVGQDKEEKPILYFRQIQQGLVLNRTNADRLAASLGDEMDNWAGKKITLTTELVRFGGRTVPGIVAQVDGAFMQERRPPSAKESAQAAQAPFDDDPDLADDPIA
jgi:hypothetical protein